MRKTIEASLVLSLSIVITLLVMATITPTHPRMGGSRTIEPSAVQPAVFINDLHYQLGTADANSACPYLLNLQQQNPAVKNPPAGLRGQES